MDEINEWLKVTEVSMCSADTELTPVQIVERAANISNVTLDVETVARLQRAFRDRPSGEGVRYRIGRNGIRKIG